MNHKTTGEVLLVMQVMQVIYFLITVMQVISSVIQFLFFLFCQVDKDEFFQTQVDPVAISTFHPKIASKLNISWPDVRWVDLRKPFYSLLAARLKIAITRRPGECLRPIPTTTPDQANYFIRCFAGKKVMAINTRDPQGFLMAISQCQQTLACTTNTF